MSHIPHELAEEFPNSIEKLHDLNVEDAHLCRLFDEYRDVNRAIHRAETNIEPTDDFHMTTMRKQRLALKDEIARALS